MRAPVPDRAAPRRVRWAGIRRRPRATLAGRAVWRRLRQGRAFQILAMPLRGLPYLVAITGELEKMTAREKITVFEGFPHLTFTKQTSVLPPMTRTTTARSRARSLPETAGETAESQRDPRSGFRILPLAQFARGGRWRTEAMRSYARPLLIWFTKGQGRITIAGVTRGYGAHNAVFLPPGTMHGFDLVGQVFGSILFFPSDADLDLPQIPLHLRFRDAAQHSELNMLIDAIQRECASRQTGAERALMHYAGLLSVWLQRQAERMPDATLPDDTARKLVAAYSALVERDFHLGKSVADYAAELGITPTHLSRVCNIACGRPASAILAERIHFEARRLLRDTDAPIKDIARHLGFASPAYFTRAFQKHSGKTPSAFRRQRQRA